MRFTQWIIILLIAIGCVWFYQWLRQPEVDDDTIASCVLQGGAWHEDTQVCEPEARKNCVANGYQWDEEGNRCLITDYYL